MQCQAISNLVVSFVRSLLTLEPTVLARRCWFLQVWPRRVALARVARQVLPSTPMDTSETVHFKESVLQWLQQGRPCKQHCPLAEVVQSDPGIDVLAKEFHGHQACREWMATRAFENACRMGANRTRCTCGDAVPPVSVPRPPIVKHWAPCTTVPNPLPHCP